MNFRITLCYLFVLLPLLPFAQDFQRLDVPFFNEGVEQNLALVGGLSTPRISNVDLNNDGLLDVYVLDKYGNVQLTFLSDGTQYHFRPEYLAHFPVLKDWVLLRDYNQDGIMDIFAASNSGTPGTAGIEVHTGYYENQMLKFNKAYFPDKPFDMLHMNNTVGQVYSSIVDIPAIDDIDCDGDLDIISFGVGGGRASFFQNQSVEAGYGLDSLIFNLEEICWGDFYEIGIQPDILLSSDVGVCAQELTNTIEQRHAGSTLLTLDLDGDNDKDLLIADISFNNITALYNGRDCNRTWMNEQVVYFPDYDVPAAAATFSATYYVDGDFDGIQDLIVAPNSINESSGEENMWFYKNTGTNDAPVFQLENKRYLLDQMLDFGQGASPTFVDYNADGLLDIVVGNGRYIERGQDDDARLWLFENIGTSSAPAFELADSDYLQFSQFNGQAFNYAPTFGDMDNDGDMDLVVGSEYGTTFYAENLAGANAPFDFGDIIPNWQDIDPGQSTKPFVVDVNEDGKNDLLIGERNGNVNYYENIGTVTNPVFNSDVSVFPNNSNVGGIDTRVDQILTGYTAPVVIEIAGGRKILTGSESRDLLLYDFDRTTPLTDSFALEASTFGGIREGVITRPAAADINGDGKLDLLVGNARGGLSLYTTDLVVDSTTVSTQELGVVQMQLFPNPVQELLTVELANSSAEQAQVELYNLNGELVMSKRAIGERVQLAVGTLPKGVYCIKLQTERGVVLRKIVVQ